MTTLGYVGLGLMGLPMTRRLLSAGRTVHVWNRTAAKMEPAVADGAIAAASAAEVARHADIVCQCLTDTAAVEAAVFGPDGIAEGGAPGKVLVDFSSMSPATTREFSARLKAESGMGWVDAPVSGGTPGAVEGTLAVMAGGEPADVEAVRETVLLMAARFTHMGPSGAGQTAKLCNQVIVGCAMTVLAEATRLAEDAGIDAERLPEALKGGFADSIPLQLFVPRMVKGEHDPPLGYAYTMLKDLDEVLALAKRTGTALPFSASAAEAFRALVARNGPEADALKIYALSGRQRLD
ncbi:MAG: NAD(P)-dependent oxidoreductase [Pseudomonadota bacterium]